ncbi:hypothetical protein QFZ40_004394 [Arthrobacter pascens]|nr:hypothetical protein [Arthrobacter pascens]
MSSVNENMLHSMKKYKESRSKDLPLISGQALREPE